jgi:hypothetical protein
MTQWSMFDSKQGQEIFLRDFQADSEAYAVLYPVGTEGSFSMGKSDRASKYLLTPV